MKSFEVFNLISGNLPSLNCSVKLFHFLVWKAEGDVGVELDDDGLHAVRRDVELRAGNTRTPEIRRSLILKYKIWLHIQSVSPI